VLEGPVPGWKIFGLPGSGNGSRGAAYGLPRFSSASFRARFPFGKVLLEDERIPFRITLTGWSPFVPGDPDNSSLPVAALEFSFSNPSPEPVDAVYSFNSANFMATGSGGDAVTASDHGFILWQSGSAEKPWEEGALCAEVDDPDLQVNHLWFRGAWFDPLTMVWQDVQDGECFSRSPVTDGRPSPGASLFVPFQLAPGETKTIRLRLSWYVPHTSLRSGWRPLQDTSSPGSCVGSCCEESVIGEDAFYSPWYAARFPDIQTVARYWREHYDSLHENTLRFTNCFYDTTLPPEVVEAIAANLTILKSPTVLRQSDGRLWGWEGCRDSFGCCAGSCTHVWNYAQSIPHLFPGLERTLRQTEFNESQDEKGHQAFRSALPIGPTAHDQPAAADGQLGGIMKVYREWRISGDTDWLRGIWPQVKASLDYCINTWDPRHKGVLEEPHHNTYDIEFWGPDGMCCSIYLGALKAAIAMGEALNDEVPLYASLLERGRKYIEGKLFNGEYFYQKIQWQGLDTKSPIEVAAGTRYRYSPEAIELFRKEGPRYQYGNGCLSDGVIGAWMATVCGVDEFLDVEKIRSHLRSIHKYNFRRDLSEHANPQRPGYAVGKEGGLLLCTWPKGGRPSLPFVYSDEVWTGIEYQAASHFMLVGMVEEGLEIVRTCRDRYDGRGRNPFNEYECGHWYARAMASYALLQGLTGIRYDAVDRTLYVEPSLSGDFRSFFSTATGYGTAGVQDGEPFVEIAQGQIAIEHIEYRPTDSVRPASIGRT